MFSYNYERVNWRIQCVCLCSCTERCVPDSRSTCLWKRLRARALCWGNGATAKTANTAVQHPYLVYKYQFLKLTHPFLTHQNRWASVVLQCSIIQQHRIAWSIIMNFQQSTVIDEQKCVHFLFLMHYITHDKNHKLTLFFFFFFTSVTLNGISWELTLVNLFLMITEFEGIWA